jgi:hypothetical protein
MAIPLPMLAQSSLTLRRKIPLILLFCSGIFVMICAILRAYYSIAYIETLTVALGWASREILVASVVVCAPSLKPLFSSARKKLTSGGAGTGGSYDLSNRGRSLRSDKANETRIGHVTTVLSGNNKRLTHYKLSSFSRSRVERGQQGSILASESRDHINSLEAGDNISIDSSTAKEQGIHLTTEYTVTRD